MCPPPSTSLEHQQNPTRQSSKTLPSCVPTDTISQAAYDCAASHLHPDILAHSLRVFLLAKHLAEKEASPWQASERLHLLFTACIFHDIGACDLYDTAPVRFEIEGVDAARSFLTSHSVSSGEAQEVWMAIALHDTPQIAERIPGLVRIVRLAVMADFKRPAALVLVDDGVVVELEKEFARGGIEKVLGDAVVDQALRYDDPSMKAPTACWPGELLRAKLAEPEWEGVNKGF